ncbi:MAG: hypothetical protein QNJ16_06180 [Rhodobacter sp.]|nr:hypothetical protein [Rhodobacter sp.]
MTNRTKRKGILAIPLLGTFLSFLWLREVRIALFAGFVVWVVDNAFDFSVGYTSGFETGKNAGIVEGALLGKEEFEKSNTEAAELAMEELKSEISDARTAAFKALDAELQAARNADVIARAEEEAGFRANLATLVSERYQAELETARSQSYAKGVSVGKDQADARCQLLVGEFSRSGALWRGFESAVEDLVSIEIVTETRIISLAEAIVEIADQGRSASERLREQLNDQVEKIRDALNEGDLERVRELALALEKTLPVKREIWEASFSVLSTGG